MDYRLGLDIGTNSIGWSVLELDSNQKPIAILRAGSRIYSDGRNPKDGSSLAVARRLPRQQRRRRDRYLRRRERFMNTLVRHGLMPANEEQRKKLQDLDPYSFRALGLYQKLTLHQLGRALFHLNQRRGFLSNRRVDKLDENESGKIKTAISRLRQDIEASGAKTLGEYLDQRRQHKTGDGRKAPLPVRARLRGVGAKSEYDLYVDRSMIAQEFDSLWAAQALHHPGILTDPARDELRDILLYQRDLRPVDPGRCTFETDDFRAPLALPMAQRFRLLQELNHLRVVDADQTERKLTLEERDRLLEELSKHRKLAFSTMRRRLKLPPNTRFSHENPNRTDLLGDETAALLSKEVCFGERWYQFSLEDQTAIVEDLLSEKDEEKLIERLISKWGLNRVQATKVSVVSLPDGHLRLGRKALKRVVPELERSVVTYDNAVRNAGYINHSFFYTGEFFQQLPYYGRILERHVTFGTNHPNDSDEKRYGRIANPTVHIGLNQTRKLVNALIAEYGHPREIVVELARELKLNKRQREALERQQKLNQERNKKHAEKLTELGLLDNGENRLKLRLWEELNPADPLSRRCVFTGEQISIERLFSPEVEVEHLLPFSRTLDDGIANKTISLRRANRYKGSQTPFEAFSSSPEGFKWPAILERANLLPENKRWRFAQDAMQRFSDEGDFLARHLNETRYLSRLVREYLTAICPPNKIWVTSGRLTEILRAKWGLNEILSSHNRKNRNDHRHHAIDAAVIAVTDRSLLQRIATAARRAEGLGTGRLFDDLPEPWNGYRDQVATAVRRCVVSHKPDHGVQGALHNDTAYGFVSGPDNKNRYTVVHRVPLHELKSEADIGAIRDDRLRAQIQAAIASMGGSLKTALAKFSEQNGTRRVRVVEVLSVIPIKDRRNRRAYKAYKGDANYCYEIVQDSNGVWDGELISTFEANQSSFRRDRRLSQSGKPLVMRLCKNDLIAIKTSEGERRIMRVVKFSEGRLVLAEHNEGGNLKARDADNDDTFKYLTKSPRALKEVRARRVFVDIIGRVKDPGSHP